MGAHWPRAHSSRWRLMIAILVCVATSLGADRAEAATHVAHATHVTHATHVRSNITRSTTWKTTGSPYILDAQVSVTASATLTIKPGVTVEFNGRFMFFINGTIKSIGTAAHPITFTSTRGAAGHGAPGQYVGVNVQAGTRSRFSHTSFRYGGLGSGGFYAYGVLAVDNPGTRVSIDHSVFEHNEYSGLHIGDGVVRVTSSKFEHNGDGISQLVTQSPGQLTLSDSTVSHNAQDGLFFNVSLHLRTFGSSVQHNLITANGSHGIDMEVYCSTPRRSFPYGSKNDIYANGKTSNPADGSELSNLYPCRAINVDWTGNYWGEVQFYSGPTALLSPLTCEGQGPPEDWFESDHSIQPKGYLGYSDWTDQSQPPPGPLGTGEYPTTAATPCPDGTADSITIDNVYNSFHLRPGQISKSYIPIP